MTQTPEVTADAVGPSDAELITAVRSGDQEAFGELFARHQAAARGLARQLVRDPNEADDLVSESFAKILQVLRGGGGPDAAFRAYLYTTVRRVAYDRTKAVNRVRPTDDLTPYDAGVPFVDPALEGLEKTLVASAFKTLPERWQAVLWHTEVEGLPPAQVGALLGLTANGVSALAYRAREGLRQAYLQQHLAGEVPDECAAIHDKLGAYARGGLSRRETAQVDEHLEGCAKCRALVLELTDVSHGMRVVIGPLILGTAGITALKAGLLGTGVAAVGHIGISGTAVGSAPARWFARASQSVSGAGMPAVAASVVTVLVVGVAGAALAGGLLTGNHKANLDAVSGPKNVASGQAGGTPSADLTTPSGTSGPHVVAPSDGSGSGSGSGAGSGNGSGSGPANGSGSGSGSGTATGTGGTGGTAGPSASPTPSDRSTESSSPSASPSTSPTPSQSASESPSGSPSPSTSPSSSPSDTPSPSGSPSVSPSDSPSPSTSPSTSPSSSTASTLSAQLEPLGDLVAGLDGILGFTVSAQGDAGASGVTATVTLPPGVELTGTAVRSGTGFGLGAVLAQPFVVSGDWICLGTTGTITCTGPNVAPGGSTSVYLRVRADDDAAGTTPVSVTVSATGLTPVTITGTTGVAAKGVSARYAGSGRLAVTEVGAPLLSCPTTTKGCADARAGRGDALNDDNWTMTYVDQDGDPSTVNSSVTNLTLDPSADVVFAGLYWSGDVPAKAGDGTLRNARLTDPTGVQTDVVADRVAHATASSRDVYQAFADVTDQVSQGGAGKWTFGGAALATGAAHYGGWSLVVVYGDASLPVGKVTVFEGFQSVNPGGDLSFNVAGTAGHAARIGLVAWEGDAGISGDRMTLDGATLTPTSGRRDANNVGDSTATGATDVNSFGVDVKPLMGATFASSTGKVDASTATDVYLIGVVTVSPAS